MSKAALADLSKRLQGDSKDFRNATMYPEMHAINIRATSIKTELRYEIEQTDPELLKYISDKDIGQAASQFRRVLMAIVGNPRRGLRSLETDPNVIVSVSYGAFSSALREAGEAALRHINKVLTNNKVDYVPLLASKSIQLDHTRTVAETRITSAIDEAGINAVDLVREMKRNKLISRKEYQEVYKNVLDINSYYRGNSKEFTIKGSVVSGELRSGNRNQVEGRSIINARATAFRKAVEKAIASNDWLTQAASDSYSTYLNKQLNNAAVKAGASGKLQNLNTKASSVRSVNTIKTQNKAKEYSALTLGKRSRTAPLVNLASITAYINARLPQAIRANMGPGSLVNRTGRFSESARVVASGLTAKGHPSLAYTYQRNPYDVFDPVLGSLPWNIPSRNPKRLIEKSIRDIAREIIVGRFYLRRA